jgi:hypothetical protein
MNGHKREITIAVMLFTSAADFGIKILKETITI